MSWMNETTCPRCGADEFDPDCDEVDVGVGTLEGNLRGVCRVCGHVGQCGECYAWLAMDDVPHDCPGEPNFVSRAQRIVDEASAGLVFGATEEVKRDLERALSIPENTPTVGEVLDALAAENDGELPGVRVERFVSRAATPAEVADLGGEVEARCAYCLDRVGGCPNCRSDY